MSGVSSADLAAGAAITAAVLSLIGIILNVRSVSRAQREQWRREQERPVVARCLLLSSDAHNRWADVAATDVAIATGDPKKVRERFEQLMDKRTQDFEKGLQLTHELRYEVAQLDLLASTEVRRAAADLVNAHDRVSMRVATKHDGLELLEHAGEIVQLQAALVERARADLGLSSEQLEMPRGLTGRLAAARTRRLH
jgi:hypothetical protein